jgi:hypothetical protein
MNLFQKLISYIELRLKKVKHKQAWAHSPLVAEDYFAIIFIIAVILIVLVLHWKHEIDGNTAYLAKSNQYLASQYTFASADATKAWKLTASLMNGAIIENGRLKTVCVITAAGNCE